MSGPPDSPEPRQRWRLVVARDAGASGSQREIADAWVAALEASGLPLAYADGERSRPRISFGAPLPAGIAAEAELIDVVLTERWPVWRVREALEHRLPAGWRLVDLGDVWLAGPPLAGRVVAADYRVEIAGSVDPAAIVSAAEAMLAAANLPRERDRGSGRTVAYDLRPLLIDLHVAAGQAVVLRARTRFHPELGTGRPDEVVAALGERMGVVLEPRSIVRERVLLAEDVETGAGRD